MRGLPFRLSALLVFALSVASGRVEGYELITHAQISQRAYDASTRVRSYLEDIGVTPDAAFDPVGATAATRFVSGLFEHAGTARGWFGAGAIREDDYQRHPISEAAGCKPPGNPPSHVDRPLNHFFDVQRGGGGLAVAPGGGLPAPDWALGREGRGPGPGQNQFSILDARNYQVASLTASSRGERDGNTALLFRTLGQVAHVLQDMAQPQHTRNDPHAGCLGFLGGEPSWYEDYVETRALGRIFRARGDVAPPLRLDGHDPVQLGAYRDFWANAQGSGLSEFSSRNFFSAGTNLSARNALLGSLLGGCGGLPEPPCDVDAYRTHPVSVSTRSVDGTSLAGTVTLYLRDMTDPVTGETIAGVAVSSRSLWDQHLETLRRLPSFTLNTLNYDSISDVLLPLAVGYSAGLLDYFFRGKLDVDLVSDGADPSAARITGTNASPDALVEGTLTLYAEDSATGTRSPVTALDSTAITGVTPGGAVTSARFQISGATERFVAVYQGTLGNEVQPPGQDNPGAVIGKVLGGHRVEELSSDGTRWNLRTPTGIFPLPILRSEIVELRWGDADNTLVGRTAFGTTGQPNLLRAYMLNRLPGSVEVPLRAALGGQEVDVEQTDEKPFPFGLDVGGLQLNSAIDYQQYLISFVHTTVVSNGVLVSDTYSDGKAERAVSGLASATFTWRLTLDLAKFNTFRARPYLWQLQQIGLTRDGRLVALVRIRLTQLDPSLPESFAVFPSRRFVWCGQPTCASPPEVLEGPPARVVYGFGRGAANHWALVDVSQGRVAYSTTAGGVVIDNVIQATQFREFVSGPFQGLVATEIPLRIVDGNAFYPVDAQGNLRFGTACTPPPGSGHYEVSQVASTFGVARAAVSQYPPELTPTEFPPFSEHLVSEATACLAAISGLSPSALVVVASDEARVYLNDTLGAFRVPDGSERVALLLDLGQALATNFRGDYARVVAWDPLAPSASLRHEVLTGDNWQLITAAHGVAVIGGINSPALTAVPLEGSQAATVFPMPLGEVFNFLALSPAFLYHVNELKFYRYRPGLLKTALPATLAVGGSAAGDYHAIRLP